MEQNKADTLEGKKVPTGFMKMIKELSLSDIIPIFKMILAFLPGKCLKIFKKNIWVISELEYNARDNGYWLFKYIRENHKEQCVYYAIDKKCADSNKVIGLGNVIQFNSFKHCILFWACSKYASTYFFDGVPFRRISVALIMLNLHGFAFVFLNHGMARGYSPLVDGLQTNYAGIIAASEKEKQIIVEMNNQEEKKVFATGFCRFDNLDNTMREENLILIMPTWRENLQVLVNRSSTEKKKIVESFMNSVYYKSYFGLLNNNQFIEYIEENNLKVIFYLHRLAQNYRENFSSKSKNIMIASQDDFFVQDLLKRAALLITDYSSVYFDYSYMRKPMIYFQFDKEEFSKIQYSESEYYSYEEDGFGPIVENIDDLLNKIVELHKNEFSMDKLYENRVEEYFVVFDNNHCEKVYNAIWNL